MKNAFLEYYRCIDNVPDLQLSGPLKADASFFPVDGVVCYGRRAADDASRKGLLHNSSACRIPFDLDEVAHNCRYERYVSENQSRNPSPRGGIIRKVYYATRPLLPVAIRKHLQRLALHGWEKKNFPRWPVDMTVDAVMREVLAQMLKTTGQEKIPFIWFWPEGYQSCLIMTHDVEHEPGRNFCSTLMDIDESFGIKSSFQVVPEKRYEVTSSFIDSIKKRGFEVNVHGLYHDGRLFDNYEEFHRRAPQINRYAEIFEARGFRSPVMYRNPDWMQELDFDYDMSFPNTAHLDPQHGGCATITPYFIGKMVELPLTTLQDYTIFHILRESSIDLWRQQIEMIQNNNGLLSFIVHPDYIIEPKYRRIYEQLLRHISAMIQKNETICLLPAEASDWWRKRSKMRLVKSGNEFQVIGQGSERARVAYATLVDGKTSYSIPEAR